MHSVSRCACHAAGGANLHRDLRGVYVFPGAGLDHQGEGIWRGQVPAGLLPRMSRQTPRSMQAPCLYRAYTGLEYGKLH